ncbi:MAG: MATE family efflux transporter [Myxococcales bacterium FL481]|nr:MAG: MATE family efflux transporter [Myxococcales bacterium FL481]
MGSGAQYSHAEHLRRVVRLGIPLVVAQLGTMALGVVDTLMLGQVGVHELDAAALANAWQWGSLVFGMGVMMGLDPIISQAHGAGDPRRLALALQRGVVVALGTSVPITALWWFTEEGLRLVGQDPQLAQAAGEYARVQWPSIAPFLIYLGLRSYLQGRRIVAPAVWIMLIANGFNIVGNWALIWGHLGLPPLGLIGAGIATGATRSFLCVGTLAWIFAFGLHRAAWIPWSREAVARRGLREVLDHGLPVGLQYSLESWAFHGSTLLAGWLGKLELAAHAIVFNLAAVSFMMPLGVSMAAATTVGNHIGARQPEDALRSAWVSFALGGLVMALSAAVFVGLRWELPVLYTADSQVVAIAAATLPVAATFQIFDGVQAVGGGVLRGMGNTRPAVHFNFLGYYVLGLPAGAYLAFVADYGLQGLWWGFAIGLSCVAILLILWVKIRGPRQVS